ANVRSHVEDIGFAGRARISAGQFDEVEENARTRAAEALKPFGYYPPSISADIVSAGTDRWRLNLRIDPGPPLLIEQATVELRGDGAMQEDLRDWHADWPLREGAVLNQAVWEEQKSAALAIAHA